MRAKATRPAEASKPAMDACKLKAPPVDPAAGVVVTAAFAPVRLGLELGSPRPGLAVALPARATGWAMCSCRECQKEQSACHPDAQDNGTTTDLLDHVGSDLSDTISQGLQVSGKLNGEDGRIRDPQVVCLVNLQVGSDDTAHLQGQHGAGRRRVVLCLYLPCQPLVPLSVGLNGRSREDFFGHERLEGFSVPDLPCQLETLSNEEDVGGVSEVVWIDDGVFPWVRRVQVDLTGRQGMLQSGLNGDRIVTALSGPGQSQQELDMTDLGQDEVVRVGLVNGGIACLNGRITGRTDVLDGPGQVLGDLVPISRRVVPEEVGDVGISDGRVDKRQETLAPIGQGHVDPFGSGGGGGGLEDDFGSDVIGDVLSDPGEVDYDGHPDALEVCTRADPRGHEHVGRTDGSSRQDDLGIGGDGLAGKIGTGGRILNAGRGENAVGSLVPVDFEYATVGQDVQVVSRRKRIDVSRFRVRSGPVVVSYREHVVHGHFPGRVGTHQLAGLMEEVATKLPHPDPELGSGLATTPIFSNTVVHSPTTGNKYPG
jgi:hypothetical protein